MATEADLISNEAMPMEIIVEANDVGGRRVKPTALEIR